jgi:hypothetical protein
MTFSTWLYFPLAYRCNWKDTKLQDSTFWDMLTSDVDILHRQRFVLQKVQMVVFLAHSHLRLPIQTFKAPLPPSLPPSFPASPLIGSLDRGFNEDWQLLVECAVQDVSDSQ